MTGHFKTWNAINCAEVWGCREMILRGYKFDDIKYFLVCGFKDGVVDELCENCKHTFGML